MADLIIKPTTGSGNKLILQDQAGNSILESGDTAAAAKYGFGTQQVRQWRKLSTLNYASTSDAVMGSPFDGTARITPSFAGNFIRAEYGNAVDHGATWRGGFFTLQWSSDGGLTYYGLAGGSVTSQNESGANVYGNQVFIEGMFNPNSTNEIRVRVLLNGHISGTFNRHGQYNNASTDNINVAPNSHNGIVSVGHWIILEDLGAQCTTTDVA